MKQAMPEPDNLRDERLMALFEAACELPEEQRRSWLLEACEEDLVLVDEVLERLHWEKRMAGFLLQPLVPRAAAGQQLQAGDVLGRIRIVRTVAEGGMAVVYEGLDEKLGIVAVKVPKALFRDRLIAEAKHALQVTHANICRVHDVGTAEVNGTAVDFLTMEFLEGETLQDRLRRSGALALPLLKDLTAQLCAGIGEAHRRGVMHGDLKGNNVVLTDSGDGSIRAVITDFGLARRHDPTAGMTTGSLRGAPDFIAPELWLGAAISPASDIYALGVLLYEAGTARRPCRPVSVKGSPPSPQRLRPELPERWSRMICRCLSSDPAARPLNAAAIAAWSQSARAMYTLFSVLAVIVIINVTFAGLYLSGEGKGEPLRLAVITPDVDEQSGEWGAGIARYVSGKLARFRSQTGPVIVVPWSRNEALETEQSLIRTGATHIVRTRFRRESSGFRVAGSVYDVRTRQELRTFGGVYTAASIASLPRSVTGAVAASLRLQGPVDEERLSDAAWPDYMRGQSQLLGSRPDLVAALAAFDRAAQLDAASSLPWAGRTEALLFRHARDRNPRDLDAAKESLRQAELRDPDDVAVHQVAGWFYTASGLHERAVSELTRVLQLEPGNVDATRRLAKAYAEMNLPNEAVRTWQQALASLPNDYRSHLDLGQFYYRRSQYPEAVRYWEQVTRIAPEVARGFHNLGAALNDLGRFAEAETAFAQALRLQEHSDTLLGFGSMRAYQGRHFESVKFYERAAAVGPRTHILLSNLGDSYRRTNRRFEARKAYKEALELADDLLLEQPRDAYIRVFLGYICARLGENSRAHREVTQALRFAPEDAKVIRRAALAHAALRRVDLAEALIDSIPLLKTEMSRHPDLAEFRRGIRF